MSILLTFGRIIANYIDYIKQQDAINIGHLFCEWVSDSRVTYAIGRLRLIKYFKDNNIDNIISRRILSYGDMVLYDRLVNNMDISEEIEIFIKKRYPNLICDDKIKDVSQSSVSIYLIHRESIDIGGYIDTNYKDYNAKTEYSTYTFFEKKLNRYNPGIFGYPPKEKFGNDILQQTIYLILRDLRETTDYFFSRNLGDL